MKSDSLKNSLELNTNPLSPPLSINPRSSAPPPNSYPFAQISVRYCQFYCAKDRDVTIRNSRDHIQSTLPTDNKYPFPVHLDADEIALSDEYADADPYSVGEAITSPFQKRRIDLTLELMNSVAAKDQTIRILDIGCGEGHITGEIQKAFPKADIHALDYSFSAISKAYRLFPGILFSVADALKSPYPEGPFDIVVCNNLWEHVSDPLGLLMRMKAVLKPRGFVIISTPSRYHTQNLIRVILGRSVKMMSKHHITEYTVGQVHEQLAFGGFEVIESISRPNRTGHLKGRIASRVLDVWRRMVGSHHQLETTIFYLARGGG